MNITDVPSAVLLMQYRIARFPLQVIEERFVARLGVESPARLFYERTLGTLDVAVGNALGDSGLATRGAALAERSDARRLAAQLDAAAGDEFTAKRKAAAQKRRNAQSERKRVAAQTIRKPTAAVERNVDQEAAERPGSVEAVERATTDAARAKLRDAQEKRSRDQADLADAEKQERHGGTT